MSRLFTCSRCGCQRAAADLNGINLTATGWNDDSKAYCKRLSECKSAEADETLDWLLDACEPTGDDDSAPVIESDQLGQRLLRIQPLGDSKVSKSELHPKAEFKRLFPTPFDFNGVLVRRSPLAVRNLAKRVLVHPADYQALPSHLRAEIEHVARQVKENLIAEQLRALSITAAQSAGGIADRIAGGQI